ncbi:MAG: helix-turn-helix transcriptional regulator [Leptolyngbya sp. BL-A-14]
MSELVERVFPAGDRKIPLHHTPLNQLPTWGHWLETPHLIAAMLTPGPLEVNLLAPFAFISTRFQPGHGIAAFDSDQLLPYRALPGGYDVVPQGSTYRSIETAGCCILLAYKQPLASRIMAEYTQEATVALVPGQIQPSRKGTKLAQALHAFFTDADHWGGSLYLESLATLIMGHVIQNRSTIAKQLQRVPDYLTTQQLKAVLEYIQTHLSSDLKLYEIAHHLGVSPYYLAHTFKDTTGLSPYQYVLRRRVEQAQRLLRNSQMSIAAIAYEVGFGSQSHMTTVFRKALNITPGLYRQQATP